MHVKLLNYSTPRGHEEFIERAQQIKMFHEGPLRSGFVRPMLSEWRVFDFRVPEDKVPEFAKLVGLVHWSIDGDMCRENITSNGKILRLLLKTIRFFARMGTIKPVGTETMKNHNWRYTFLVGTIKDPKQNTIVNNIEREVL
jgi:hypothetical protein